MCDFAFLFSFLKGVFREDCVRHSGWAEHLGSQVGQQRWKQDEWSSGDATFPLHQLHRDWISFQLHLLAD